MVVEISWLCHQGRQTRSLEWRASLPSRHPFSHCHLFLPLYSFPICKVQIFFFFWLHFTLIDTWYKAHFKKTSELDNGDRRERQRLFVSFLKASVASRDLITLWMPEILWESLFSSHDALCHLVYSSCHGHRKWSFSFFLFLPAVRLYLFSKSQSCWFYPAFLLLQSWQNCQFTWSHQLHSRSWRFSRGRCL